jgi:Cu-processing system permease protein
MSTTLKLVKYPLRDVIRSRWLIGYALFFLLLASALIRFSDGSAKAALSLVNVVLFIVPLVAVVFGTMYVYDAREFVELLLAHPVGRRQMFAGLYLGMALPLSGALLVGLGVPFVLSGLDDSLAWSTVAAMLLVGVALTCIFLALALLIAVRTEDRVKGLGLAITLWLATAVVYDGLVMLAATVFADYPLEQPMLGLMLANPVDLARVVLLLRFDAGALMGYTGAVFERFFGTAAGTALALTAMSAWLATPLLLAHRRFARRDF